MYQFQVRSELGRELVAEQQPKQQIHRTAVSGIRVGSKVPSLNSFRISSRRNRLAGLVLMAGCVVSILSGCGGLILNNRDANAIAESRSGGSALSSISCGTQSLTGAQTKACSVHLDATARKSIVVSLTSSNAALKVPTSVTVSAGATSAGFNAVSSSVTSALSVTIKGYAAGVTKTDVITLYPASTASGASLSKVSCGSQTLTGPTTTSCSVDLSAAASSATAVTLSSNNTALKVPSAVTVAAGAKTASFSATASAVSTTESATISAVSGGVTQTDVLQLEASGTQASTSHQVQLSWIAAPASSDPAVGYLIYRSGATSSSYQRLNSTIDVNTSYTDGTVQSGQSYEYVVKSVDASGIASPPSNATKVTIP